MTSRVYTDLADPAFTAHFTNFRYTAWRLETLQEYRVPAEAQALANFRANGYLTEDDLAPMRQWCEEVVEPARDAGKYIGRVHVVAHDGTWDRGVPGMSEYMRFEFAEYRVSSAAGEDVNIIMATTKDWPVDVCLPGLPNDFWLFDSSELVEMRYHPDGSFREAHYSNEITAPAAIVRANLIRDAAMHRAAPFYP